MKRKTSIITIISAVLLICALFSTIFLDNNLANRLSTVISIITALAGTVALLFQFKRDKDINQASFILEFGKYFNEIDGCNDLMQKLELYKHGDKSAVTEKDYDNIVKYLQWCEMMAVMVKKRVLDLNTIDNLYSYNFFLIVNNDYVQRRELVPEKEYYRGIFELYMIWSKYKKEKRNYDDRNKFGYSRKKIF